MNDTKQNISKSKIKNLLQNLADDCRAASKAAEWLTTLLFDEDINKKTDTKNLEAHLANVLALMRVLVEDGTLDGKNILENTEARYADYKGKKSKKRK